jgi:hypothetical protein
MGIEQDNSHGRFKSERAHDALSLRSQRKWQTSQTLYQAPKGGFLGDHIYHRYARFVGETAVLPPSTLSGQSSASAFRNQNRESLDPIVRSPLHPADV